MDLKDVIGGLLNQTGSNADKQSEEGQNSGEGANPLGSILTSLGGGGGLLSQILGSVAAGDSEQRGGLVGSILSGLGSSGVDLPSLLQQLGINPEVADNPEAASHEDLTKLATHAQENAPDVLQSAVDQNFSGDTNTDEFNIDNQDDDSSTSRSAEASTGEDSSDDDSSNDDSDDRQR
jgi:hypothetical protein